MNKYATLAIFTFIFLPAEGQWWKQNNLRLIQTNLPAYEAATLDPDSLAKDLVDLSANTLIINAGGIMAFYPTKLDFQYINPYMKPDMLGDVIRKCHERQIRVIVRFDFSRVEESIFKAHPDWCYLSPKGERIVNTNMYVVSVNSPYVQDRAFRIMSEVMELYPIDGIFLNMPGYQVNDAYQGKYHGIDQNEYDRKRFFEYSHGLPLPKEENKNDSVYKTYLAFKHYTTDEWSRRLHELVRGRSKEIAICTYSDRYVDIIRHESQASPLPYWPYGASDNVNNASHSFPDHIISNSSIQQISFQSRYNAVEPEEVAIRLYENIANGSGLDVSLMGDMRGYEDERNFPVIRRIYALHKKFEPYFGKYRSLARIAVIAPGLWPSGLAMQEYRGILLMLNEAHIPYDIIGDAAMASIALKNYELLILPDINFLGPASTNALRVAVDGGTNVIATNSSLYDDAAALWELFGAKVVNKDNEGSGNYLRPDSLFKSLRGQSMIYWKYNLGLYDFSGAEERRLPILSKGRPGPPEIIGGHAPTGYYAMGMKRFGKGKAVLLPENIGRLYYQQGYKEHKNILLDIVKYVFPAADALLRTDAPARVETILQQYTRNMPGSEEVGMVLHLVNLTGFSGNTYFPPLALRDLHFTMRCIARPSKVWGMLQDGALPFSWKDGYLQVTVPQLDAFEGVVVQF